MRKPALCLFFLFVLSLLWGDNQVSVTISSNLAKIGDPLVVKFILKSKEKIASINIKDEQREYEIIKEGEPVFNELESHQMIEKELVLTFFKIGDLTIGPFTIELFDKDRKLIDTVTTNTIPLTIQSSLEGEKDIKDLKDLAYLKSNPFYTLKYVFFFLVLALAVVFGIILFKRMRTRGEQQPIEVLSPIQEFEKRIKELRKKELFEQNRKKEFSLLLSSIIKQFLAKTYQVNAEDLTTTETIDLLQEVENLQLLKNDFKYVFANCDLIKFAKFNPGQDIYQEVVKKIDEVIGVYKQRAIEAELKNQDNTS